MRFVVLDTETTGLNRKRGNGMVCDGHRIVEIGCVEMVGDRITGREFHSYVNSGCCIDPKATGVHGVTNDFLTEKPTFEELSSLFIDFIKGATLIIHNAPFDIAFIDKEFLLLPKRLQPDGEVFHVVDTLDIARGLFPGGRNDLDSLCERFGVQGRQPGGKHGALFDARILARVFLELKKK